MAERVIPAPSAARSASMSGHDAMSARGAWNGRQSTTTGGYQQADLFGAAIGQVTNRNR